MGIIRVHSRLASLFSDLPIQKSSIINLSVVALAKSDRQYLRLSLGEVVSILG